MARKAKEQWIIEKPKLDDARQSNGISSTEPNDEAFKRTMKTARRKLEPMPAAMLRKTPANCRSNWNKRPQMLGFWMLTNL